MDGRKTFREGENERKRLTAIQIRRDFDERRKFGIFQPNWAPKKNKLNCGTNTKRKFRWKMPKLIKESGTESAEWKRWKCTHQLSITGVWGGGWEGRLSFSNWFCKKGKSEREKERRGRGESFTSCSPPSHKQNAEPQRSSGALVNKPPTFQWSGEGGAGMAFKPRLHGVGGWRKSGTCEMPLHRVKAQPDNNKPQSSIRFKHIEPLNSI